MSGVMHENRVLREYKTSQDRTCCASFWPSFPWWGRSGSYVLCFVLAFFPVVRPFGMTRPSTSACGLWKYLGSFLIATIVTPNKLYVFTLNIAQTIVLFYSLLSKTHSVHMHHARHRLSQLHKCVWRTAHAVQYRAVAIIDSDVCK